MKKAAYRTGAAHLAGEFWFYLFSLAFLFLLFYLYRIPLELIVLYASAGFLYLLLRAVFSVSFFRNQLQRIENQDPSISERLLPEQLPVYEMLEKEQQENQRLYLKARQDRQEIEDYFGLWAHQAKIPLMAAKCLLEDPEFEKRELSRQLDRMEEDIEKATAFIRLESPTSDFRLERVSVNEMLEKIIGRQSSVFIRNHIALDYQPADVSVLTDRKWFTFIAEQLITNALKYSDPGSCLHIACYSDRLEIRDEGCGILPSDLPRIFEKGFTGSNGHNRESSSGLGLYLAKGIAGKLNHVLRIDSKAGEYTKAVLIFNEKELSFLE